MNIISIEPSVATEGGKGIVTVWASWDRHEACEGTLWGDRQGLERSHINRGIRWWILPAAGPGRVAYWRTGEAHSRRHQKERRDRWQTWGDSADRASEWVWHNAIEHTHSQDYRRERPQVERECTNSGCNEHWGTDRCNRASKSETWQWPSLEGSDHLRYLDRKGILDHPSRGCQLWKSAWLGRGIPRPPERSIQTWWMGAARRTKPKRWWGSSWKAALQPSLDLFQEEVSLGYPKSAGHRTHGVSRRDPTSHWVAWKHEEAIWVYHSCL